jgi:hypothetical protein
VCSEAVAQLLGDLERSEREFARAYLGYREVESKPGHFLSVDDAKANAVVDLLNRGISLPETIRFRLHAMLLIERAVEPS